jgi:hypothetical protein
MSVSTVIIHYSYLFITVLDYVNALTNAAVGVCQMWLRPWTGGVWRVQQCCRSAGPVVVPYVGTKRTLASYISSFHMSASFFFIAFSLSVHSFCFFSFCLLLHSFFIFFLCNSHHIVTFFDYSAIFLTYFLHSLVSFMLRFFLLCLTASFFICFSSTFASLFLVPLPSSPIPFSSISVSVHSRHTSFLNVPSVLV